MYVSVRLGENQYEVMILIALAFLDETKSADADIIQ